MKRQMLRIAALLCALVVLCCGCVNGATGAATTTATTQSGNIASVNEVPAYSDEAYVEINGNVPQFSEALLVTEAFETYMPLDYLGRCGTVLACVGREIMPTEERGEIGQVKPTGWHTVKYDIVDGKYLYNRCHLIGYQLTGENANERNLITGTRYLNVEGMLPFEDAIADYVKETGNHVIYRVTPVFHGTNLLAHGVQMEAQSVEDNGKGICFNVYAYNVQPGIVIDYVTGESELKNKPMGATTTVSFSGGDEEYVLNTSSKKFHIPSCKYANSMKAENREISNATREYLMMLGYEPCKTCGS